jgi:phosphatidylserine/phosphatidylglycerophosphate/cardiolipin synthase-like enzyme
LKHLAVLLFIAVCLSVAAVPATAQSVIINELLNTSANTDEWVELLVVQDSVDMRGWNLRDFSSGGAPQDPLVFSSNAIWSNLTAGTIIVIGAAGASFAEDLDPTDGILMVKSSNASMLIGNVFVLAGGSDAVQLRNPANTHIFGVSWGSANSNSLPAPRVHFSGSSTSNTSISFNGNSLAQLTNTGDWTINNTAPTIAAGNTPANIAWIASMRNRADGSGSARVSPDTLFAGDVANIQITYRPDTSFAIGDLRIIIPPAFIWVRDTGSVGYSNMSAVLSVTGDTIYLNGITFQADSAVITVSGVTAPDSTALYPIVVQSKGIGYGTVGPTPRIVVFGLPVAIASVKENDSLGIALRTGDLVTVVGVVTVANQFGGPSSIQDASGGISIFTPAFHTAVTIGDEVKVSGVVTAFNGLNQLGTGGASPLPVYLHEIISSGNTVTPLVVTCAQIANDGLNGNEEFEGRLVRLNAVTVTTLGGAPIATWGVSGAGTNYRLNDATGSVEIRVDNDVNFANTPAPQGQFDVIGVVGQFKTTAPFIGGYQVMPRFDTDIHDTGPIIAVTPVESNIQQTSLTITWGTVHPGTSRLRYGLTPAYELGVVGADDSLRTSHTLSMANLQPATIYQAQAFSVASGDTSFAPNLVVSTSSPAGSTGEINVYFNQSVMSSLAWYQPALGNQNFPLRLIERINNARRSIDVALYSLSGTVGANIASALVNAKNRGVKVRVIGEYDNRTTAPWGTLSANGIPVVFDLFGANDGTGLQHNKFFIFDSRGGAAESIWVWTGSWNPTDPGTLNDYQNVVEIQDVALAGAYTVEFNEMWGSSGDVPDPAQSRFGARKRDNTPHRFVIGGRDIELYFSPTDRTTSQIISAINAAEHSVAFGVLTLTRADIANALIARRNVGRRVRGVLDNGSDLGSQYNYLISNSIDVHLKIGSGLLHHKYGIIDAENPHWSPVTITGSHNWSSAAENTNNENTLLIRDGNIANQFLQEFAARYYQFGGNDSILVGVYSAGGLVPMEYTLDQNYPNPFNPTTTIRFGVPERSNVELKLFDILGREVTTLVNHVHEAGTYTVVLNGSGLASGVYFYRLEAGSTRLQRKLLLLK